MYLYRTSQDNPGMSKEIHPEHMQVCADIRGCIQGILWTAGNWNVRTPQDRPWDVYRESSGAQVPRM